MRRWFTNFIDWTKVNYVINYVDNGNGDNDLVDHLLAYIHRQAIVRPNRKISQQGWSGSAVADFVFVYCRQDLETVVRILALTSVKLYTELGNATAKTYKDQHQALVEAGFYGALPNVSK